MAATGTSPTRLSKLAIAALSKALQQRLEPPLAAKVVGLNYVQDTDPGLRRIRRGKGFVYRDEHGKLITDWEVLSRIRALVIPPAWTQVWICSDERGHIQATGIDQRGRKQYRYHPEWRAIRDATKFHRLPQFAAALSEIREKVDQAFALPGLPREKILAAVIRLLDRAHIRVGNVEYADANGSFGLTTLQNRHCDINGSVLKLKFRGKSGQLHEIELKDARLAKIIKRCSDLPGQTLFQYLDDEAQPRRISSTDVNALLKEWTGADFTAKDFRTWAGTVQFVQVIQQDDTGMGLPKLVKAVASTLGNTPTVCKKFYIHPALLEAYDRGELRQWIAEAAAIRPSRRKAERGLDDAERLLLRILARIKK